MLRFWRRKSVLGFTACPKSPPRPQRVCSPRSARRLNRRNATYHSAVDTDGLNATLLERAASSPDVAIFRVRPDETPIAPFVPGQFVRLGLAAKEPGFANRKRLHKRAYSIASSPLETNVLELLIARVPGGRLTPRLWEMNAGERCYVDTHALGRFTLDEVPRDKDLALIATGTGIAPFVSMLRTFGAAELRWRKLALLHGARTRADLAYHNELVRRERGDARVRYLPTLSREPEATGWSGARGRVQALLDDFEVRAGFALDPQTCEVLLCGNPEMITSVEHRLTALGFTTDTARVRGNVHHEAYW